MDAPSVSLDVRLPPVPDTIISVHAHFHVMSITINLPLHLPLLTLPVTVSTPINIAPITVIGKITTHLTTIALTASAPPTPTNSIVTSTTAAISIGETDTTVTPAIVIGSMSAPRVLVAVAGGRVKLLEVVSRTMVGGVGDGGPLDEEAAAVTTMRPAAVTTSFVPSSTIPSRPYAHPTSSWAMPIDACCATTRGNDSSLLLIVMIAANGNISIGGRGRLSGAPQGDYRLANHSRLPPTVVGSGSAGRGGDRPSVFVEVLSTATSPRPGPASLLSPSLQPQPGCRRQHGGRVGGSLRAAEIAGTRQGTTGGGRSALGAPSNAAVVIQGTEMPSNVGRLVLRLASDVADCAPNTHTRRSPRGKMKTGEDDAKKNAGRPAGRHDRSAAAPSSAPGSPIHLNGHAVTPIISHACCLLRDSLASTVAAQQATIPAGTYRPLLVPQSPSRWPEPEPVAPPGRRFARP